MSLIPCKACGNPIAKNAPMCPQCGNQNKQGMSGCTKAFLIGGAIFVGFPLVVMLVVSNIPAVKEQVEKDRIQEQAAKKDLENEKDKITLTIDRWEKGGFGSVILADITIKNGSRFTAKDFILKVQAKGNSGTAIGTANTRTLYETLASGESKSVKGFNFGLTTDQAKSISYWIEDETLSR